MGIRKFPWVFIYPWIIRIEIPARVWGRTQVSYLYNGAETDLILLVPIDIH